MVDSTIALLAPPTTWGLDSTQVAAGQAISQQIATSEWLGPLAPVALSPFFGLTALSGIATYGPDWLQQRSQLVSEASLLNSPLLFWSMLVLTLLTSLPRLTKVSKPLALAGEQIETYSAIIILVAVRMFSGSPETGAESVAGGESQPIPPMLVAGLTLDILMSLVAMLNVLVINGVKLFCEFAVWIIPFPSVDAIVELANKSLCVSLMSLYCFSPAAATAVNLLLLIVCAIVFGWTYRRVRFYREVIAGPVLAWLIPSWFAQRGSRFRAFCNEPTRGLPKLTPVVIEQIDQSTFRVDGRWWWRRFSTRLESCRSDSQTGLLASTLTLTSSDGEQFVFMHRHWVAGDTLYLAEFDAAAAAVSYE